jgi:aerobic-type carbon monoxide dehydrogenase small subunit (CoxS/CutS family)
MLACRLLALQVLGRKILTVEGLAERDDFRPILQAFMACDAGQWLLHAGFAVAAYAMWRRQFEVASGAR